MRYDVVVIGAGVNGLATAAYVARAGRTVLVCDRRPIAGGLCATEEFHPGFRANTCVDDAGWVPPGLIGELGLASHGLSDACAVTSRSIAIAGAARMVITPDMQATSASIRPHSSRDAARWPEFCMFVARLSGFLEALYGVRPPAVDSTAPADLVTLLGLGRRLRGLGKRGMVDLLRTIPMPIADVLDEWFESDALKGALSTLGVLNVQHGPQSGGTGLVFLHNHVGLPLGGIGGRRVSRGGVGALASALVSVVTGAGGTVRTSAEVSRIRVRDDRVMGVTLTSGEEIDATHVVSSTDPRRTFTTMLDAGDFDPEYLHAVDCIRMRGPQVRIHLAVAGPSGLPDGTVVAPDVSYVERAYDAAKHGRSAERPWLHVSVPSANDPSLAPAGQDVVTIHAQYAAYALRGGWTEEARSAAADAAVTALIEHAPGVRESIIARSVLTPTDVAQQFGATEGSLLHGELTLDQFLFARPVAASGRYATPVRGLWLCGSGTHPGAGTAGASGRLAAKEMLALGRGK